MHDNVYGLTLTRQADGSYVKSADGPAPGFGAMLAYRQRGYFTDAFGKDLAPSPVELIQQLVGIAYACATLNANGVASATLRLFVRTGPAEPATRWRTAPLAAKALRALKAKHPRGRLWAVFEPRSATACRAIHQTAYESAFGAADDALAQQVVAWTLDVASRDQATHPADADDQPSRRR